MLWAAAEGELAGVPHLGVLRLRPVILPTAKFRDHSHLLIARRHYDSIGGHPDDTDTEAAMLRRMALFKSSISRRALSELSARRRTSSATCLGVPNASAPCARVTPRLKCPLYSLDRMSPFVIAEDRGIAFASAPFPLSE